MFGLVTKSELKGILKNYVSQDQLITERIRILDFCLAHVVSLLARLHVLEEELRLHESIPSLEQLDLRVRQRMLAESDSMMRDYDEIRQTVADLVIEYRRRNPPPY